MSENTGQRREEEIFEQVLKLESELERIGFLKGACGDDQELYARLVDLLQAHGGDDNFFKTVGDGDRATLLEIPVSEGPGSVIGRYKLLQQIGDGGMGVVYMAEQEEPVKRKVALKIIKLGMDTKHVVTRFEAERQALAMMDHPNIARVLDGGATETGRPFFVMELVHGVPITEFCDKNKLSAQERLELFLPVCQAIQSAHHKGIIHRDIKPSNVLVTLHHGDPMAKVIDFGIAKATNQKLTEKTLFTNFSQMIGTPAYMSPEQAEMSSMDVDTRTDIYSLGVLLYELLTGTTPLSQKRLKSLAYGEMQRVIAEEEPQKPSTRMSTMEVENKTVTAKNRNIDVGTLSKQFKGDIDWIVMKCLEKDRRRRYGTPQELLTDLKRFLNNEPVSAAAPSFLYQFQKLARRHKTAFGAAAAVSVILVIGTTVATWQAILATKAEQEAIKAQRKARELAETEKDLRMRMEVAKNDAESLRLDANRKLYDYFVDQARLAHTRKEPGFRSKSESFLKQAVALDTDNRDMVELRNEAIAVMMELFSADPKRVGVLREPPEGSRDIYSRNKVRDELAVLNSEGSIEIQNFFSGETPAVVIEPGPAPVQDLAFGRGGDTLISAHKGGAIRVWRRDASNSWSMSRELSISKGGDQIDFVPGDLAVGEKGFVVLVRESDQLYSWKTFAETLPKVRTLPEFRDRVGRNMAVSVSPDCRLVAIPSKGLQRLLIWDLTENRMVERVPAEIIGQRSGVISEFSPDGSYLAVDEFRGLTLYDTRDFNIVFSDTESDFTGGIDFSPDSSRLVYGYRPTHIRLIKANRLLATLEGYSGRMYFSRTKSGLLHSHRDGAQTEWVVDHWPVISDEFIDLGGHSAHVRSITFHPSKPMVVTGSFDKTIRFWDSQGGQEVQHPIQTSPEFPGDVTFSPDHRFFVNVLRDDAGTIQIRDAHTLKVLQEERLGVKAFGVAFSEAGPHMCVTGNGKVKVWSYEYTTTTEGLPRLNLDPIWKLNEVKMGWVSEAKFSPNGRYLAYCPMDGVEPTVESVFEYEVRLWNSEKRSELPLRIKASKQWRAFDFTEHDTEIVVIGLSGEVELWDIAKGKRVKKFKEGFDGAAPFMIDVSPDGRYLAFANRKGEFGVFDLREERMLFSSAISTAISHPRWNQNGTQIGIGLTDGDRARVLDFEAIRSQLDELGLNWE